MRQPIEARLYLLFTPELCLGNPWDMLQDAIKGGVDLVQWRIESKDPDGLARCLSICTESEVPVIVNDFPELAVEQGAAGAHVGQKDLPAHEARNQLGPHRWLGISTHDIDQAHAACDAGADYLGFGPCFPTPTKGYSQGQPSGALGDILAAIDRPVFAIGGINEETLPSLLAQGCTRIAVSSAILHADDPRTAARTLRDLLP